MMSPPNLNGLTNEHAYQAIIEYILASFRDAREPRALVQMDQLHFDQVKSESYEAGFKMGMNRGQRNLVYYMYKLLKRELTMGDLRLEEVPKDEMAMLDAVVERLTS